MIAEQEEKGKLFVIRPESALEIDRVEKDPARLRTVYDIGRATAARQIDKLREFLSYER